MATDPVVYSNAVSYLDPANNSGFIYRPTAGQFGGAGVKLRVEGTLVPTTGDEGLPYRMVRIPTTAIVKYVGLALDAAITTFDVSVGVYFSDSTVDGTPPTLQGLEASKSFFAYNLLAAKFSDIAGNGAAATHPTDGTVIQLGQGFVEVTFANATALDSTTEGYYVPSASHLPLWAAIAFGGNGNGASVAASPSTAGTGAASSGNLNGVTRDPGGMFDITLYCTSANSGSSPVTLAVEYVMPMA